MLSKSASIIFIVSFLSMITLTVSCRQHRTPKTITFVRASKSDKIQSEEKQDGDNNISQEYLYLTDSLFQICVPAPLSNSLEQIIRRKAYILSYNKNTKIPNWVAWHLTSEHTDGVYKRVNTYFEDNEVPFPKATDADYHGSGWTHGHMCPAGDNKWDMEAMRESNILTNICPQDGNLNTGLWNRIEQDCRKWAKKYGDVYVVCGPILLKGEHSKIGKNKIVVPEAFFKVILRLNPEPKAIGYIIKNNDGSKKRDFYVNTIDEVERITSIDFFPSLPDEIENVVESNSNLDDW